MAYYACFEHSNFFKVKDSVPGQTELVKAAPVKFDPYKDNPPTQILF